MPEPPLSSARPLPAISKDKIGKALDAVVKALTEEHGPGTVARLGQRGAYAEVKYVVPTGIPALDDDVFGVGGLPLGRLVEIYGREQSLKTTFSRWITAAAQAHGATAHFLDFELSGSADFDRQLGAQESRTLISQPDTMEDGFALMLEGLAILNKAGVPSVYVYDSLAASKLKAQLMGELDEGEAPAEQARFLGKHLAKLIELLKPGLACVVIVNQIRDKVGAPKFAKQSDSPGGHALKHFCHVRIETSFMGQIRKGEKVIGLRSRFKAVKNKVAPPFGECVVEFYFDPLRLVPEAASRKQPVQKAGSG
mgnify:CR=1 FL=1